MHDTPRRRLLRWSHLVFSIPIIGYLYSPFEHLPAYAPVVRYIAVPGIAVSGLWMWKGQRVRRLVFRSAT